MNRKLLTPEKIDKNRRVAWSMYYQLLEENSRLRKEIVFLHRNRRRLFRLCKLLRRSRVTPEIKMLAEELRKEMYFDGIIGISGPE